MLITDALKGLIYRSWSIIRTLFSSEVVLLTIEILGRGSYKISNILELSINIPVLQRKLQGGHKKKTCSTVFSFKTGLLFLHKDS